MFATAQNLPPPSLTTLYFYATKKTAKRRKGDQYQESPIPPAIKDITGNNYQHILPSERRKDKPIEQEYYRQKQEIIKRIEKHILSISIQFLSYHFQHLQAHFMSKTEKPATGGNRQDTDCDNEDELYPHWKMLAGDIIVCDERQRQ